MYIYILNLKYAAINQEIAIKKFGNVWENYVIYIYIYNLAVKFVWKSVFKSQSFKVKYIVNLEVERSILSLPLTVLLF